VPTPVEKPAKVEAAFFDVDNTILRGSSSFLFGKAAYKRKFFSRKGFWASAWHQFRFIAKGENTNMMARINDRALGLIEGRKVADMQVIADEVYEQYIAPKLWPETVRLAKQHVKAGREVWLITAAPMEIAEIVAHRLGLTGGLGTIIESKNGIFTGKIEGKAMHGKAKAQAIRKLAKARRISIRRSYAYSDSHNDLPMLTLVGHANVVNPDTILRVHAKAADWPIFDFKRRELRVSKREAKAAYPIKVPKVRKPKAK
jgi:HAD superfamily hydrolase (TIGR01490 family)